MAECHSARIKIELNKTKLISIVNQMENLSKLEKTTVIIFDLINYDEHESNNFFNGCNFNNNANIIIVDNENKYNLNDKIYENKI